VVATAEQARGGHGGQDGEMSMLSGPYYRHDLALVHHKGFAFHAEACAAGILELLEPVRRRGGLVVEIGCGSGLLTGELVKAGHRVVATDASPAMLELARHGAAGAEEIRRLTLPDDPLPPADAVVGVGHALNYLPDAGAVRRALRAMAGALRPGGVLAVDICDLEYGSARREAPNLGRVEDDWAIVSRFSTPSPDSFVREPAEQCLRLDEESSQTPPAEKPTPSCEQRSVATPQPGRATWRRSTATSCRSMTTSTASSLLSLRTRRSN
jgi:SAM-dependent methyltransferase